MNRLLTAREAAEMLQLHVATVRRLAESGELPGAVRVGRRWRFNADALLKGVQG